MKQILSLITAYIFSFHSELIAQNLSNKYRDSVKDFFSEWIAAQKEFENPLILDTSVLFYCQVDSMTLLKENEHFRFSLNGTKAYKYRYPISDYITARIDSITFSKKELEFLVNKMQKPAIQNWDIEIFPKSHFVKKREVDSFFKLYYSVWSKASDVMSECNYDTLKMKSYSICRQFKQMQQNILWDQGYWKFSNPVFLKNGSVALIYYWLFSGNTYVCYEFNVYKKENGHWNYFGYIDKGSIN